MSNEIAVVYGASGFLGSHVADALSVAGYKVRLFDRAQSRYQTHDQEMIIGDIMNLDQVTEAARGADVVYNFAAIADIDEAPISRLLPLRLTSWEICTRWKRRASSAPVDSSSPAPFMSIRSRVFLPRKQTGSRALYRNLPRALRSGL